jgi:uncharacterized protein (DUF2147 family)
MKKISKLLLICLSLIFFQCSFAADSPQGYWKTIDDVTGKPKSILHIFEKDGVLYGQIVKIFPRPGYDQNELCTACTGYRHNKRIVGMVIMEGLKQSPGDPNEWNGGEIMDPLNGKTYRCYIQVIEGGSKLNVRGYIGISLFGRSQTWLRVSGANSD